MAGMPFGEETVTETVLLDLKISYPGTIWIVPFNKHQESKIGADWEWCFASEDEEHFLPMLVQAKVLDDREESYQHISRTIGNTGIRQIDRLIETGSRRGVPTTYAFYNHVTDEGRLPQMCGSLLPGYSQSEPWGISIACAERVRGLLPDQKFESIKQVSKPLHCLLCTGGDSNLPKRGSPEAIYRSMGRELKSVRDDIWRPRQERPAYYNQVMELMSDFEEGERIFDHRAMMREKLAGANPELDGIVILRDGRRRLRRD